MDPDDYWSTGALGGSLNESILKVLQDRKERPLGKLREGSCQFIHAPNPTVPGCQVFAQVAEDHRLSYRLSMVHELKELLVVHREILQERVVDSDGLK